MPRPVCPKCGEKQCSRRKREGFWQVIVWPRFGWYPWQCSACRKIFSVKSRGKSKRRHAYSGALPTPTPPEEEFDE